MLGVLIVDDEVSICRLIRFLIPWETLGLELVDVVYDGFAAMDVLKTGKVDILITDAKMPGCDGIELIRWCLENDIAVKAIVISGFRQFEYAHGAIRYGADAYILKPVNQEELVAALRNIINDRSQLENTDQMKKLLDQNRGSLKDYFADTYLGDQVQTPVSSPVSTASINEKYQMNFVDGIFQMLYFKVSIRDNEGVEEESLADIVKAAVSGFFDRMSCEHIESGIRGGIGCFINYPAADRDLMAAAMEQLYDLLKSRLDVYTSVFLDIGIDKAQTQIAHIRDCRKTAVEAAYYRLRDPLKHIFYYEDYTYVPVAVERIFTKELRELAVNAVMDGNSAGLRDVLFKCRTNFKQIPNYSPASVYDFMEDFSDTVVSQVSSMSVVDSARVSVLREKLWRDGSCASGESEVWQALDTFAVAILRLFEDARDCGQNRPVQLAKQYIDGHFAEQMTLEDVAEAVHLNPKYLCSVFRQEAGLGYSDYVTAKRMEYASQLLRRTRMTVADIAVKCGYQDVKYFTRLFKKRVGIKPSEYRRIYS